MNISFTKKILFSFIFITFLGLLGNLFMIIKFGRIEHTTKSTLEIQMALFTIREMEENIKKERESIEIYRENPDTALYNEYVKQTYVFNELVEEFRFKTFWADNEIRHTLNRIIATHNTFMSTFSSGLYMPEFLKNPGLSDRLNQNQNQIGREFLALVTLLNQKIASQVAGVERATHFMDRMVVFLLFFTSFISVVLCVFITKSILVPFRKLLVATRLIGQGQFEDTLESIKADEEVLEVIEAFQEMARQLKKYRDNLIETERLNAVSVLATSVSHEVNNPLMIISGIAEYLRLVKGSADPEVKEKMEAITHEIQRISRITKKLGRIKQIILEDYSLKGSGESVASSLVNLDDSGKVKEP